MTSAGRIVIVGAQGQLGRALVKLVGSAQVVGVDQKELNLLESDNIPGFLSKASPDLVINAAAYTQVDQAENDLERALLVNSTAPTKMAQWCFSKSVPFIHFSTDYVYPGTGQKPWKETDPTGPVNAYGRTKLAGDLGVAASGGDWMIFRTSWVYASQGSNFLKTMLKLGQERDTLRIVSDQIGAPSYAADLAKATLLAFERARSKEHFPSGVYHLCNDGETSWHGFATEIFRVARERGFPLKLRTLEAIPSSEYPTAAKRPLNSRLSMDKIQEELDIEMPNWKDALERCMKEIGKP